MNNAIDGLPDMDLESFLDAVSKNAWLDWVKKYTEAEKMAFIDEEYRIKWYIQQKELELQQEAQAAQWQQVAPEQGQAMPMTPQGEAIPEEQLDFVMPQ
jgi:Fe-S cluster biosynthesis and repair protein YggX